jgi:hypothetical protein
MTTKLLSWADWLSDAGGLSPPSETVGVGVGVVGVGVGVVGVGVGVVGVGVGLVSAGVGVGDGVGLGDGEQLAEGLGDAAWLPELGVGMGCPLPFTRGGCPPLRAPWVGLSKMDSPTCEIWCGSPARAKLPTTTTATTAAMARAGLSHA